MCRLDNHFPHRRYTWSLLVQGPTKKKVSLRTKKMQDVAVSALMKAREIPDSDVALNQLPKNCAVVTSREHWVVQYFVRNPRKEWAGCNCAWAQRGNICKHVVKVFLTIHPNIDKGTTACFCGKQAGNATGAMGRLLSPTRLGETMEATPSLVPTPHPTLAKNGSSSEGPRRGTKAIGDWLVQGSHMWPGSHGPPCC